MVFFVSVGAPIVEKAYDDDSKFQLLTMFDFLGRQIYEKTLGFRVLKVW